MSDSTTRTVWLDVTLLYQCNPARPTGIPRTAINLFHSWVSLGCTNLRFCRIDPSLMRYCEIPLQELLDLLSAPPQAPVPPPPAPGGPDVTLRSLYRRFMPPMIRMPMVAFRTAAQDWAVRIRAAGSRCFRRLYAPVQRLRESRRNARRPTAALGRNDIVLNPGASWNTAGAAALTERLRREVGFRLVVLVYDLIPALLPQYFKRRLNREFRDDFIPSARSADLLLAISRSTRQDAIRYAERVGVPSPPVEVIRLSDAIPAPAPSAVVAPDALPRDGRPFVLCVCTVEVRKNHLLLYHVWRRLVARLGDRAPRLVLVGGTGWLSGDLLHQLAHDELTSGHILRLADCPDGPLCWLYENCLFTVYPSQYEGWGLPVAEALSFGKYCIASNTSSLPEIAPDLVTLHDPHDVPGWERLVSEALDGEFLREREDRIRRLFRTTSWAETGREVIAHIERHFGPAFRFESAGRTAA